VCKLKVAPMQGIPKKSSRQAMTDWLNATAKTKTSGLRPKTRKEASSLDPKYSAFLIKNNISIMHNSYGYKSNPSKYSAT
ncbi:MAG: hypothetical protein RR389_08100, partial [Christensenella sp.]